MNKYYEVLQTIIEEGKTQSNKKGDIKYLLNVPISMNVDDLQAIFSEHPIAKKKLATELDIYFEGITDVKTYNDNGIFWWDYCAPNLINSYPTYFAKLPKLIEKINKEKRSSKNYVMVVIEDRL